MLESFLSTIDQLPTWFKAAFAVFLLGFSWLLETFRPAVNLNYQSWWSHTRLNLTLLIFTMIISTFFGIVIVDAINWGDQNSFGVLHWLEQPLWVELIIGLLVLDLMAQYVVHVLLHKVRWMWRLHIVHHSDTRVDATTGTRHHPGDFMFREVFALFTIVVMGIPLSYYALYRLITIPFTYFIHANISLPKRLNTFVSLVIATPNIHKYHHHFELPWTDTNYGGVLSIWDRLFGTFTPYDGEEIRYGLNILGEKDVDSLRYLLTAPFDANLKSNADYVIESEKL